MATKRIFMITHTDTSQNFGVGKYISEITKEVIRRKINFSMVIITIGAFDLINPSKLIRGPITQFNIPRPFERQDSKELLTGIYSDAVFCIINDFFDLNENDIFHFNNPQQCYLLRRVRESTPVKIIYVIHTCLWKVYYNNDFKAFLRAWHSQEDNTIIKNTILVEKEICELTDRVICLNDETTKDVIKVYSIPKKKIKLIPNGIGLPQERTNNIELEGIKKKLQLTANDFILLYVGRLNEQKGILDLVKAFRKIVGNGERQMKLIIVGEGDLMPNLKSLSKGLEGSILYTGYIRPDEIHYYYSLANAMVFPSMNEQSSYVILEAMVYKVPMIVTDIKAFDFLISEETCLKVTHRNQNEVDKNDLEKKMTMIIKKKELSIGIAHNAFNLYLENFTTHRMFEATYKEI